jgi:hypothetical protein
LNGSASDSQLAYPLGRGLAGQGQMGARVIALVLPVAQLRGEHGNGPDGRPPVELLLVGAMTPLDLAFGLRAPRRDVPMADAQIARCYVKSVLNSLPRSV